LGRSSAAKQEMLFQKGINWNDYPAEFKRGSYVQRRVEARPFTAKELQNLPPKHAAHKNPDLTVERTSWGVIKMKPLRKIENKVAVLFDGAEPIYREE
jgi:tRNA(His) 5'-end guanylyltransferase